VSTRKKFWRVLSGGQAVGARARRGARSGACARRPATRCAGKGAPPAGGDLGASLGDSCTRGRLRHARAGGAGARPRGRDFGRSGWEMGSGSRAHTRVARPPRAAPWAGRGRHARPRPGRVGAALTIWLWQRKPKCINRFQPSAPPNVEMLSLFRGTVESKEHTSRRAPRRPSPRLTFLEWRLPPTPLPASPPSWRAGC
jgi:hypothetical protein